MLAIVAIRWVGKVGEVEKGARVGKGESMRGTSRIGKSEGFIDVL
jgi:hypothetical protein